MSHLTRRQAEVLGCLRLHGELNVHDVRNRLQRPPAASVVRETLSGLVEAGYVARVNRRGKHFFRPAGEVEEIREPSRNGATDPGTAVVALRRLVNKARTTGEAVDPDAEVVLAALGGDFVADDTMVNRLARKLWASWRRVDERGFNSTPPATKAQWAAIARTALTTIGFREHQQFRAP